MLEHVNLRVPDFDTATAFYVHALGLTRDPYIDRGPDVAWFNVGRQQFHIPRSTDHSDVLRGTVVLVVPCLDALARRLSVGSTHLAGTSFDFDRTEEAIEVVGPWGNRYRCIEPISRRMSLGITAIELTVPAGTAAGIAAFYSDVFGTPATTLDGITRVVAGVDQSLVFVESENVPDYDGHHIAVYVSDFSGPHAWLLEHGLIVEDSDQHQYRFNWIVEPATGEPLFELEHEVRSQHHPLRDRPLVNRNADQGVSTYLVGGDTAWPLSV